MRELYNPIGAASDQALVERRMTGSADNEQVDVKLFGKLDDDSHRMPGDNMRMELSADAAGGK
jgi:hypothetical protein